MADARPPTASARASHRTQSSQDDFSRRLKHLQRSDPVDPQELARRLNAAIVEAKYYGHRDGGRRRLANARDIHDERTRSNSPSEASTPQQDVRQSMLNPLNVARSTLIWDGSRDDDPMSRVANALKALKDADPSRPVSMIASPAGYKENKGSNPWTRRPDSYSETSKAVARKSRAFSAPKIVEIEKLKELLPRPKSTYTSPVLPDTTKNRSSRRAPAPLILTVVPKTMKPAVVDVSTPITTKPAAELPNLEPLSPFGPTFTENGGSFLVYQPKELTPFTAFSDSPFELSPDQEESFASLTELSPTEGTTRRSDPARPKGAADYFTRKRSQTQVKEMDGKPLRPHSPTTKEEWESRATEDDIARRSRSIPSARLSQNSETDGTDAQSDSGMSPVFEMSAAQSSRTSLGQHPASLRGGAKGISSRRTGFPSGEYADLGSTSTRPGSIRDVPISDGYGTISPVHHAVEEYPYLEEEHSVSPIASPKPLELPKRLSSLPPSQEPVPESKRHSIARKAVGSGVFEGSFQNGTIRPVPPIGQTRHDSTGFTIAREFLRDSIDSEHVRHVHTAANKSSGDDFVSQTSRHQLPKLSTSIPKAGKVEEIADGICLINSDSPIVPKNMSRLPPHGGAPFREPSYAREFVPESSRHNSTAESPTSHEISHAIDTFNREHSNSLSVERTGDGALTRKLSRDRSNTDAPVSSMSSRPDSRARPLIQDSQEMIVTTNGPPRPRTAGAFRASNASSVPPPPTKLPSKITFPPRANMAELGAMSPESLKLLHEQESLLRRRYDAVLNPIDHALLKKPEPAAPLELGPDGLHIPSPSSHSRSQSRALCISAGSMSTTDLDLVRHQENVAREQAAIRAQRRNLGAAARRPSAPGDEGADFYYDQSYPAVTNPAQGVYGTYNKSVTAFSSPMADTKSAFTFDDDTQVTRKRRATWKFWKRK